MYLHPSSTKSQRQSQTESHMSLEDVKKAIIAPEGHSGVVFHGLHGWERQATEIWEKILPPHISSELEDTKYNEAFSWWNQRNPSEYARALQELKTQKGEEFRAGFLRYLTKKGITRRPDYRKMTTEEFTDMLEYADFLKRNKASSIVIGRLWMGEFYAWPQFRLRLALQGLYHLRLNGRAMHPPEADTAACEFNNVKSVFPNVYAGVRYKIASSDTSFSTICCVTVGKLDILDEAHILRNID